MSKGDPSATELDAATKRVRSALAVGPLRQTEIDALVGRSARAGINTVLDLVRIPPSGTWERLRADLHADAESWIGPPDISASDARALLGSWRYVDGRIDLTEFDPLPRGMRRQVEWAARDPAAFYA